MKLQPRISTRPLMKSQLSMGIEEEVEHTPTFEKIAAHVKKHGTVPEFKDMQKWIAEDHIAKTKDYYTRLKKVE